jgi:hypothetical protein
MRMRRGIVSWRELATDAAIPQAWSSLTFYSAVHAARDARCALAPDASQYSTRSRAVTARRCATVRCARPQRMGLRRRSSLRTSAGASWALCMPAARRASLLLVGS